MGKQKMTLAEAIARIEEYYELCSDNLHDVTVTKYRTVLKLQDPNGRMPTIDRCFAWIGYPNRSWRPGPEKGPTERSSTLHARAKELQEEWCEEVLAVCQEYGVRSDSIQYLMNRHYKTPVQVQEVTATVKADVKLSQEVLSALNKVGDDAGQS